MNNPILTNILLAVIAALLLVQVVQTGMNSGGGSGYSGYVEQEHDHSAHEQQPAMPPGHPSGGDAADMNNLFFQSVKAFPAGCKDKTILAECDSPAAQAVKKQILKESEGKGPREVFDWIVATFGEKVLTEQALAIRKMRKP